MSLQLQLCEKESVPDLTHCFSGSHPKHVQVTRSFPADLWAFRIYLACPLTKSHFTLKVAGLQVSAGAEGVWRRRGQPRRFSMAICRRQGAKQGAFRMLDRGSGLMFNFIWLFCVGKSWKKTGSHSCSNNSNKGLCLKRC